VPLPMVGTVIFHIFPVFQRTTPRPVEKARRPVAEDEIDIELRPAHEVAARVIVLATVLRRLALERGDDSDDARGDAFDLREWLREQNLVSAATMRELALLNHPVESLAPDEIAEWSWQGIGFVTLAWALGLSELPPVDATSPIDRVLALVPAPWDSVAAWLREAQLRSEPTIALERERAEVWYWRVVTEALHREASRNERREYDEAIAEVVAEAAAAGLVPRLVAGDFPVGGRRLRDLPADALDELQILTAERLRALNWLSGFGASWDDVPLDV
jgi:Domain of unknown function (DUF4272)